MTSKQWKKMLAFIAQHEKTHRGWATKRYTWKQVQQMQPKNRAYIIRAMTCLYTDLKSGAYQPPYMHFDGNPIYQATDVGSAGALSKQKKTEIFEANIPPGNHTLSVTGVIRGRGAGLFSYLSDYMIGKGSPDLAGLLSTLNDLLKEK